MTRGSIAAAPPGPFTSREDGEIRVSPSRKSPRLASSAASGAVDALPCKSLTPKKIENDQEFNGVPSFNNPTSS
jgi:hypothetical protein